MTQIDPPKLVTKLGTSRRSPSALTRQSTTITTTRAWMYAAISFRHLKIWLLAFLRHRTIVFNKRSPPTPRILTNIRPSICSPTRRRPVSTRLLPIGTLNLSTTGMGQWRCHPTQQMRPLLTSAIIQRARTFWVRRSDANANPTTIDFRMSRDQGPGTRHPRPPP